MFPLKKNIKTVWILHYLSIIVILMVVNYITYFNTEKFLMEQIKQSHILSLQQIKSVNDNLIETIANTAIEISYRDDIQKFSAYSAPVRPEQRLEFAHVRRDLATNNFVANTAVRVFVFYPNSNYIVGSDIDLEVEQYFKYNYSDTGDYRIWHDFLTSSVSGRFVRFSRDIMFYKFTPMTNSSYGIGPSVIIELEPGVFSPVTTSSGSTYMMSYNDEILFTTGEAYYDEIWHLIDPQIESRFQKTTYDDEDYVVSWVVSNVNAWQHIYVTLESAYLQVAYQTSQIMTIGTLAYMAIGFLLIYLSAHHNNKPIKEMIEKLQKFDYSPAGEINEYQYIDNVLMQTINQNKKFSTQLSTQTSMARENTLLKLITGDINYDESLDKQLEALDIRFHHECFSVVVLRIGNVGCIFNESGPETEIKRYQARFILTNIVNEILNGFFTAYPIEYECDICWIVNVQADTQDQSRLLKMLTEARQFITENFNFKFIAGISEIHRGISSLPRAHGEAKDCLDQGFFRTDEEMFEHSSIREQTYTLYHYPPEIEQLLVNALKTGDFVKCEEITNEVFKRNFNQNRLPVELARCLIYDMISTIIKSVNDLQIFSDDIGISALQLARRILSCKNIVEMHLEYTKALSEICRYILENITDEKRHLVLNAKKYVENNYSNPELNVSLIAQELSVSLSSISAIFKSHTGTGLLDYINNVRINHAKHLLRETDYPLSEISKKSGFFSDRTFLRQFSKHEGISPSQYRKT